MPFYGSIVVIKRSGEDGNVFPLMASKCVFGRALECDIRIYIPSVSRKHCYLEMDNDNLIYVTPFEDANPTALNHSNILGRTKLNHGDVITISERSFRFEYPSSPMRSTTNQFNIPAQSEKAIPKKTMTPAKQRTPTPASPKVTNTAPVSKTPSQPSSTKSPVSVSKTRTPKKTSPQKRKLSESQAATSKRRKVSFGPYLSPEQFNKRFPPSTPIYKGGTPTRRISAPDYYGSPIVTSVGNIRGKRSMIPSVDTVQEESPSVKAPSPRKSPAKISPKTTPRSTQKLYEKKAVSPKKESPKISSKQKSPKRTPGTGRSPLAKATPKSATKGSPLSKFTKLLTPRRSISKGASPTKTSPKSGLTILKTKSPKMTPKGSAKKRPVGTPKGKQSPQPSTSSERSHNVLTPTKVLSPAKVLEKSSTEMDNNLRSHKSKPSFSKEIFKSPSKSPSKQVAVVSPFKSPASPSPRLSLKKSMELSSSRNLNSPAKANKSLFGEDSCFRLNLSSSSSSPSPSPAASKTSAVKRRSRLYSPPSAGNSKSLTPKLLALGSPNKQTESPSKPTAKVPSLSPSKASSHVSPVSKIISPKSTGRKKSKTPSPANTSTRRSKLFSPILMKGNSPSPIVSNNKMTKSPSPVKSPVSGSASSPTKRGSRLFSPISTIQDKSPQKASPAGKKLKTSPKKAPTPASSAKRRQSKLVSPTKAASPIKLVVTAKSPVKRLSDTSLSDPSASVPKIISPSSPDRRKTKALRTIHGAKLKTPNQGIVSGKKKTSTLKKSVGKITTIVHSRSLKPLFSEVLKANMKKNVAARPVLPSTKRPMKPLRIKVLTKTKTPGSNKKAKMQVSTTGHVNSPATIVIGRKKAPAFVVKTRKGRTTPHKTEVKKIAVGSKKATSAVDPNLSGIADLMKTPDYSSSKRSVRSIANTTFDLPDVNASSISTSVFVSPLVSPRSVKKSATLVKYLRENQASSSAKSSVGGGDYTNVSGIKKLMTSPAKSPVSDYRDVRGVKNLFSQAKQSPRANYSMTGVDLGGLFTSPPSLGRSARRSESTLLNESAASLVSPGTTKRKGAPMKSPKSPKMNVKGMVSPFIGQKKVSPKQKKLVSPNPKPLSPAGTSSRNATPVRASPKVAKEATPKVLRNSTPVHLSPKAGRSSLATPNHTPKLTPVQRSRKSTLELLIQASPVHVSPKAKLPSLATPNHSPKFSPQQRARKSTSHELLIQDSQSPKKGRPSTSPNRLPKSSPQQRARKSTSLELLIQDLQSPKIGRPSASPNRLLKSSPQQQARKSTSLELLIQDSQSAKRGRPSSSPSKKESPAKHVSPSRSTEIEALIASSKQIVSPATNKRTPVSKAPILSPRKKISPIKAATPQAKSPVLSPKTKATTPLSKTSDESVSEITISPTRTRKGRAAAPLKKTAGKGKRKPAASKLKKVVSPKVVSPATLTELGQSNLPDVIEGTLSPKTKQKRAAVKRTASPEKVTETGKRRGRPATATPSPIKSSEKSPEKISEIEKGKRKVKPTVTKPSPKKGVASPSPKKYSQPVASPEKVSEVRKGKRKGRAAAPSPSANSTDNLPAEKNETTRGTRGKRGNITKAPSKTVNSPVATPSPKQRSSRKATASTIDDSVGTVSTPQKKSGRGRKVAASKNASPVKDIEVVSTPLAKRRGRTASSKNESSPVAVSSRGKRGAGAAVKDVPNSEAEVPSPAKRRGRTAATKSKVSGLKQSPSPSETRLEEPISKPRRGRGQKAVEVVELHESPALQSPEVKKGRATKTSQALKRKQKSDDSSGPSSPEKVAKVDKKLSKPAVRPKRGGTPETISSPSPPAKKKGTGKKAAAKKPSNEVNKKVAFLSPIIEVPTPGTSPLSGKRPTRRGRQATSSAAAAALTKISRPSRKKK